MSDEEIRQQFEMALAEHLRRIFDADPSASLQDARLLTDAVWGLVLVARTEQHRELLEAARDYIDNGGKGQPRGIQADLWNRLVDVVTDQGA